MWENTGVKALTATAALILLAIGPAIVIATWRWAL